MLHPDHAVKAIEFLYDTSLSDTFRLTVSIGSGTLSIGSTITGSSSGVSGVIDNITLTDEGANIRVTGVTGIYLVDEDYTTSTLAEGVIQAVTRQASPDKYAVGNPQPFVCSFENGSIINPPDNFNNLMLAETDLIKMFYGNVTMILAQSGIEGTSSISTKFYRTDKRVNPYYSAVFIKTFTTTPDSYIYTGKGLFVQELEMVESGIISFDGYLFGIVKL